MKTNYGKFNIRFAAVKVWNHFDESIEHLPIKMLITKWSKTSYSLTVHEFSADICLFIYLFTYCYLSIYLFILFVSFYWLINYLAQALVPTYLLYLNIT